MKIALFICDVYQTYQTIVTNAMNKYAREHGITLIIYANFVGPANNVFHVAGERSIIQLPNMEDFDGIVVAGDTFKMFNMQTELMRRIRREAKCPVVSLRELENDYTSIVINNKKAMYDMTRHFIDQHKFTDICFVTGRMEMFDAQERLSGYRQAMQEDDIPILDNMIFYGDYWRMRGKEIIDYFLDGRQSLPQAIVCSNDYMAFSVCEELQLRGIKVPDVVCVSGMDDLSEARTTEPQLTSVAVPYDEMAIRAIDAVVSLIKGEKLDNSNIYVDCEMHYRSSCGCPDDEIIDGSAVRSEFVKFRYMTKECIYMVTDYSSAYSDEECMEMTGRMAKSLELKNFFICLNEEKEKDEDGNIINRGELFSDNMHLRYYLDRHGRPTASDITFPKTQLLPDEILSRLEGTTSFVVPLHYRKDVFGYIIMQIKDNVPCHLDERYEFLCINAGASLNLINTYEELVSIRDIKSLYLKDPLTNIFNRRGFEYELTTLHQKKACKVAEMSVVSIDMDGLKYINDNFGHMTGDKAIKEVARCIMESLVAHEFCARMGGDEFIAVLYGDDNTRCDEFRGKLEDLLAEVNKSIVEDYVIEVSIGICHVKSNDTVLESIQVADELMYKDKRGKINKQGR